MKFPRNSISASLINCYNDCPKGFYLTVIEELMAEEGPALEIGSIFDFMFKEYHEGRDWLKTAKNEYFKGKFPKERIDNFGKARELMEVYCKDPDHFIDPSFNIRFEVPIVNPITEEKIEGVTLKGFLDGREGERLKELKSTTEPYTQERVDKAIQGKIYSYGIYMLEKEIYPVDWIVVGKKVKRVDRFTTEYTLEDFSDLFDTIKEFIANVEAEKFDPNPNHPFWCMCRKLNYA